MTAYLPIVTGGTPTPVYDMLQYMDAPPHLITEMMLIDPEGKQHQARHQCQYTPGDGARHHWCLTKGDEVRAEYEEFYADVLEDGGYIYRGYDTSPGNGLYYLLSDDDLSRKSRWCPRFWSPGDVYERNPFVWFYRKSDCRWLPDKSGYHRTWLRFADAGKAAVLGDIRADAIVLDWLLEEPTADNPWPRYHERYWYAKGYGMIEWKGEAGRARIVEIHAPGARPDNVREPIPCLGR